MKKFLIIGLLALLSFLIGCDLVPLTTSSVDVTNSTTSNTTVPTSSEVLTTNSETSLSSSSTSATTSGIITDTSTTNSTTELTTTTTNSITTTNSTTTTTTTAYERFQDIYLYSINDFHGGAYIDYGSFSNIGAKIRSEKENNDNVIALGNGDILQGTAFSNYYHGRPFIEAMDIAGFDGFVIGNHEFDWGIEEIAKYNDGLVENGEASYPFLAANIVYEDTLEMLDFTIPYIIKDINGVKVGVIGVIGDVINSISASRVENITFLDPVTTIADYTRYLRSNDLADVVVVYIHNGSSINYNIASLSGDERVDAVFNGHTHWDETSYIEREGADLVYAQSRANSSSLMVKITLTYDRLNSNIYYANAEKFSYSDLSESDSEIDLLFSDYGNDQSYLSFVNQELTIVQGYYGRDALTPWGASVIRDYLGIDIGAVNSGGFRTSMEPGSLTMGDVVVIYPFDNVIKTSRMTEQQILDFYEEIQYYGNDVVFDDQLSFDGTTLYLDGNQIVLERYYTVGAVDFIFDQQIYDFLQGEDITYTGVFMRDLLVQDLMNSNGYFNPYNGTSYQNQVVVYYFYEDIKKTLII